MSKADIEEIMEECAKLAKEANWTKVDTNRVITEYRKMEAKANKYDSLVEKMKERIKSVEKCYQDLIEPYFDKSITMINTSCMSKKEKEEFINKRNCLLVQKVTFEEVLQELLDTEK